MEVDGRKKPKHTRTVEIRFNAGPPVGRRPSSVTISRRTGRVRKQKRKTEEEKQEKKTEENK